MKKTLSIAMALLLAMTTLASCSETADPAATTTGGGENTTAATTTKAGPVPTLPPIDTNEPETETSDSPYDIIDMPNATAGSTKLQGYECNGLFTVEDGKLVSDGNSNMMIVTNDTMTSGKLTATFMAIPGNNNDNGIFFGMEPDTEETYYFWENGPAYYFLFVSDASTLYLAKVSYNGKPWTVLKITDSPIPNYVHGETEVTIAVEFDGLGSIKCYANGELLIDYTDSAPLEGSRYGVRCEVPGVVYESVVAEHG